MTRIFKYIFSVESVAAFIALSIGEPAGRKALPRMTRIFKYIFSVESVAAFIALSIGEPVGVKSFATEDTDF